MGMLKGCSQGGCYHTEGYLIFLVASIVICQFAIEAGLDKPVTSLVWSFGHQK